MDADGPATGIEGRTSTNATTGAITWGAVMGLGDATLGVLKEDGPETSVAAVAEGAAGVAHPGNTRAASTQSVNAPRRAKCVIARYQTRSTHWHGRNGDAGGQVDNAGS